MDDFYQNPSSRDLEKLKRIKALMDAPGDPGEGEAARVAYENLKRKIEEAEFSETYESEPQRKYQHPKPPLEISGAGGWDYYSAEDWQDFFDESRKFNRVLCYRWCKSVPSGLLISRWRIVDDIIHVGEPFMVTREYGSGLNQMTVHFRWEQPASPFPSWIEIDYKLPDTLARMRMALEQDQ